METVKDKLDRLNDLAEEQIQSTEKFSEEMSKKIDDRESALATTLHKVGSNLLGGLVFTGVLGFLNKARESQLQEIQTQQANQYFIKEAKKDFLEENKEEIEEQIDQFMEDKARIREFAKSQITEKYTTAYLEKIMKPLWVMRIKQLEDGGVIVSRENRDRLFDKFFFNEEISKLIAESIKQLRDRDKDEIEEQIELLIKNEREVKKLVKLHIKEKFLESFKMQNSF